MNKIYFLICISFITIQGYSQNFQNITSPVATEIVANHEEINNLSRGGGEDPFWSSDFSDATMWATETVSGNFNWEISTNASGWFYQNGQINSNSGGEYAFVWNGDPTDADEVLLQGESNLTTVNAIDVSTLESAVLEYQLYGARFTDSLQVQVSTDGQTFSTVSNSQDIGQLTAGGGAVTANPLLRSVNITLNVQEQDSLWVRFKFQTAATGIAYGWFIDDVNLVIPEPSDLAVGLVYTGDIINDYEYTMTPIEQAHNLTLGAEITNLGGLEADATLQVEVFLDGTAEAVYTGNSEVMNLTQGQTELVWIFTDFTPSAEGDYTVEYEVMQTAMDGIPEDNTNEKSFRITDFTWANDDFNAQNTDFDGSLGDVLAEDEWIIGTAFTVFEEGTEFQAAEISVIAEEGTEISMTLWRITDDEVEFITDTEYTITDDDASVLSSQTIVIEMDDQEELEVGETYIVGLNHFQGEPAVVVEASTFDNDFSTWIFGGYGAGGATDWFVFDDISPVIRLLTDDINSVDELDNATLVVGQNYPNPMNGNTTIPFSLESASNVSVRIMDVTGKVIFNNSYGKFNAGQNQIEISDLELSSGLYTYEISTETFTASRVMVSN